MHHLRYLDLSGNPLAEETGYRLLIIKSLPWLETLDMHKVHRLRFARLRERALDSDGVLLTPSFAGEFFGNPLVKNDIWYSLTPAKRPLVHGNEYVRTETLWTRQPLDVPFTPILVDGKQETG